MADPTSVRRGRSGGERHRPGWRVGVFANDGEAHAPLPPPMTPATGPWAGGAIWERGASRAVWGAARGPSIPNPLRGGGGWRIRTPIAPSIRPDQRPRSGPNGFVESFLGRSVDWGRRLWPRRAPCVVAPRGPRPLAA